VPAVGSAPHEGWLARLAPVIYPAQKDWRAPLETAPPGCPQFDDDSVVVRPERAPQKSRAVAPGLHRAEAGGHHVVWWDPAKLRLDAHETMGLRQHRLLTADKDQRVSGEGAREYAQWQARRAELLAAGGAESCRVAAATELAAKIAAAGELPAWLGNPNDIEIQQVARTKDRPHGTRFGTLVHAILSRVALDADAPAIAGAAGFFARMIGANQLESSAACEAVAAALGSPMMKAAAAAGSALRRECSILLRLADGTAVEGVVDLAFPQRVNGIERWVVCDFKTDADLAGRLRDYRIQLSIYARAIGASTGAPVRGILVWV
jgi:hypothetical protein